MTTSPSATSAAWLCTDTIAMPAPLPPNYGEVRLQIPVFRCGQCRRMTGGMTLRGQEMRHQRFPKNRDIAISLAAPGLSYARAGNQSGCVKSTVCQWLRKSPLAAPELPPGGTLELDGLWTRTRSGRAELKVIRNAAAGTALGTLVPRPK